MVISILDLCQANGNQGASLSAPSAIVADGVPNISRWGGDGDLSSYRNLSTGADVTIPDIAGGGV